MNRFNILNEENIIELKEVINHVSHSFDEKIVLEEMSTYLFGIAIDYGFYDTEVREWIWSFVENYNVADN